MESLLREIRGRCAAEKIGVFVRFRGLIGCERLFGKARLGKGYYWSGCLIGYQDGYLLERIRARKLPVALRSFSATSSGVPQAMTVPPMSPPSGPRSTM